MRQGLKTRACVRTNLFLRSVEVLRVFVDTFAAIDANYVAGKINFGTRSTPPVQVAVDLSRFADRTDQKAAINSFVAVDGLILHICLWM